MDLEEMVMESLILNLHLILFHANLERSHLRGEPLFIAINVIWTFWTPNLGNILVHLESTLQGKRKLKRASLKSILKLISTWIFLKLLKKEKCLSQDLAQDIVDLQILEILVTWIQLCNVFSMFPQSEIITLISMESITQLALKAQLIALIVKFQN